MGIGTGSSSSAYAEPDLCGCPDLSSEVHRQVHAGPGQVHASHVSRVAIACPRAFESRHWHDQDPGARVCEPGPLSRSLSTSRAGVRVHSLRCLGTEVDCGRATSPTSVAFARLPGLKLGLGLVSRLGAALGAAAAAASCRCPAPGPHWPGTQWQAAIAIFQPQLEDAAHVPLALTAGLRDPCRGPATWHGGSFVRGAVRVVLLHFGSASHS